ncbi:hypothetical protein [Sporosarcina aquimarina]|uniref:Uncharacterized protein n=1 Tax=Sporosarcina aquimarina TaxID=114975 RepID=A0ABU4FY90_9BACL|nr:hypothetical protein [Sporosarcina aquimarina]MDW0109693.1 hypothetical protein [Sporosarcina aquimarina]
MKKVLYIFFVLLCLINLTNMTLLNGEWNGFALWLSTGLFVAGTAYYVMKKNPASENEEHY